MDARTLKALKKSIAKWQEIVDGTGFDVGPQNCALCTEFYHLGCDGCPVKAKTGQPWCDASPYEEWQDLFLGDVEPYFATDKETRELAQRELDFLKSLLKE